MLNIRTFAAAQRQSAYLYCEPEDVGSSTLSTPNSYPTVHANDALMDQDFARIRVDPSNRYTEVKFASDEEFESENGEGAQNFYTEVDSLPPGLHVDAIRKRRPSNTNHYSEVELPEEDSTQPQPATNQARKRSAIGNEYVEVELPERDNIQHHPAANQVRERPAIGNEYFDLELPDDHEHNHTCACQLSLAQR